MSDDTRPYKAGFEAMHERMHGGAAMDTLENAQKRAEYWKAEHLAANAEIERLRTLIRAHVTASNNDDTAGDTFGALMAEVPNAIELTGAASPRPSETE